MCKLHKELQNSLAWLLSVIGAGGSGKTSTALWIIENWFPEDNVAIYKYHPEVLKAFPEHIRKRTISFEHMGEIAGKPYIILLDDTALHFLSRSTSGSDNKDLVRQLTIARHNDQRIISTAQNSILIDKGVYESLDQYSLRCRMTDLQALTEREEVVQLQLRINEMLQAAGERLPANKRKGLRYCPETGEILYFPAVPWMNDTISKPYKGYYVRSGELTSV